MGRAALSVLKLPNTVLRDAALKAAAYTIVMMIMLMPLMLVLVPPLIDYPNHLAKTFLAIELPDNRHLSEFYEWRLRFVPNLAQDFILPPLAKLFGVYTAGRLFLAWSLIQLVLGVALLRYAVHQHVGYWPLLSVLFLYNKVVGWGFLNYLFTSGLVLIVFAVWILMERRGGGFRIAVFAVLFSAMFFLHLIATAVLILCIAAYQAGRIFIALKPRLGDREGWRIAVKEGLVTLLPLMPLLLLWLSSPTGTNEQAFDHRGLLNFAEAVFSPFTLSGSLTDFWFALAVMLFATAAFALRQVSMPNALILPCLCLLLVAITMPAMVLGVFGTHYRVPFLLCCIVLAGIQLRRPKGLFAIVAALVIAPLFAARIASMTADWLRFDSRLQQYPAIARTLWSVNGRGASVNGEKCLCK